MSSQPTTATIATLNFNKTLAKIIQNLPQVLPHALEAIKQVLPHALEAIKHEKEF